MYRNSLEQSTLELFETSVWHRRCVLDTQFKIADTFFNQTTTWFYKTVSLLTYIYSQLKQIKLWGRFVQQSVIYLALSNITMRKYKHESLTLLALWSTSEYFLI